MQEKKPVVVVDRSRQDDFESLCQHYVENGYKLHSSAIGVYGCEPWDDYYKAIFVLPEALAAKG